VSGPTLLLGLGVPGLASEAEMIGDRVLQAFWETGEDAHGGNERRPREREAVATRKAALLEGGRKS
jgi:hypothetical protein